MEFKEKVMIEKGHYGMLGSPTKAKKWLAMHPEVINSFKEQNEVQNKQFQDIESSEGIFCKKNSLILKLEWGKNEKPIDPSVAKFLDSYKLFEARNSQNQGFMRWKDEKGNIQNIGEIRKEKTKECAEFFF